MKRVRVHAHEAGLVVRNNVVNRVLTKGCYWLGFGEKATVYDLSKPFPTTEDLDLLLQLDGFAVLVDIVEVADHEICVVYVNKNFSTVLSAGRHVFWKGMLHREFQVFDVSVLEIPSELSRHLFDKLIWAPYVRQYKLDPSEKGLLFVDGKLVRVLDAGTYYWWKNTISVAVSKADMRVLTLEIVGQEILSKDKAQIRINFSVQYQIKDIVKALLDNKDYEKQLYTLLQLVLRAYIGQMTLDELMENKSEVAQYVIDAMVSSVQALGLVLLNAGMKDIILPGDVREIMNQVLIAEKSAQANIITRREETASTRSLLNTAKLMEENAMLFKLKEMEYVEKIAERINSISVSGNGQIVDQLKQLFVK